jgi:hypothetical protein
MKAERVILDTNVLISAALSPLGKRLRRIPAAKMRRYPFRHPGADRVRRT